MEATLQRPFSGSEIPLRAIVTATVWCGCLAIGLVGFVLPYAMPSAPKAEIVPFQAEILNVELTTDPLPPLQEAATPGPRIPPPAAPRRLALPSAPSLTAVAAPSAAVAFALPVTVPARVVEASQASYSAPVKKAVSETSDQAPVAALTFGRGEGKQPAPDYPRRALSEGQEGVVRVLFTVGSDGRTVAAEAIERSPWPLLNEAAVRVIRDKWRFSAGAIRRYEVPIHFKIKK